VRVVIAEDSVLLREGIGRLEESGFEVAGHAGDGEDLLRKVGAHKPDIAVVDIRMPPTHTNDGLRAAHRIRAEHPVSERAVEKHVTAIFPKLDQPPAVEDHRHVLAVLAFLRSE
jgi:YesN/AraC family two-component response regulator